MSLLEFLLMELLPPWVHRCQGGLIEEWGGGGGPYWESTVGSSLAVQWLGLLRVWSLVGELESLRPQSKPKWKKKERNFLAKVKAWGEQRTVSVRKTVRNVAPWKHNKRACWLSEMWVFLKVEIQTRIATEHLSHHSGTNPYPTRQWCVEFGLLSLRLLTAVWRKQWGHADLPSEFQRLQ